MTMGNLQKGPDWKCQRHCVDPKTSYLRCVPHRTAPYNRLCMPPATTIVSPVTYAASSDARYATQAAMSPGVPNLFRKVRSLFAAAISGVSTRAAANLVGTVPAAALQFSKLQSACSSHRRSVKNPNSFW